jgi:small-conductance mechanosensitive channel
MLLKVWNHILSKSLLWVESVSLFTFIFVVGFLFKRYVAKFIQNIFAKTGLVFNDKIVIMIGNYISFWFFLIAAYAGILKAPVNTKYVIIDKFFYGILAFSIVILVSSVVSQLFRKVIQEKIISNILKFLIIFIGLVLILNQVGVKLTPILTALGIGSLAVALALQDTFANFFSGINILASKQIARNDYIKLDSGHEGTVVEVNWRTTLIREMSNATIVVPNSKISSAVVKSYHYKKSEILASLTCGVAYGSDLSQVEKIAVLASKEVISKYNCTSEAYHPVVFFTDFADSSIKFVLYFKVRTIYDRAFIKSEILKNLYTKFNDAGIKIPFIPVKQS